MLILISAFAVLISYDISKFIKNKEPLKVYIVYSFLMAVSFTVSMLIVLNKRPQSPAEFIEYILKIIGVVD